MPTPRELDSARQQIASESNAYYTWSDSGGWRAGSGHPTRQTGSFLPEGVVERLEDQAMEQASVQEAVQPAREEVAEETEGRYQYTERGGWRAGPEHETRPGAFISQRQQETLETRARRRAEATPASAQDPEQPERPQPPAWVGRDRASGLLGVTRGVVTRWGGEGRFGRRTADNEYQYAYMDVMQEAARREDAQREEAAEAAEEEAPPTWDERVAGGLAGAAANTRGDVRQPIQHGRQLVSAGVAGATGAAQSVAGFVHRTLETALSAAGGMTGAGAARIGRAATQLITRGLQTAASAGTAVAGAVVSLLTGALAIVGTGATIALGGALIGLFTGAIAAIGVGLANAVSETVGAVADSAEQALSGVVSVLQDLTQLGRQFSEQGFGLRALGGMEPGQDLQTLLFGQAVGADLGGMMSSWGSRPEFMRARFSALGMQYDPGDVPGSMMGAAARLREMPGLLQAPMANVVGAGHGQELLRMAHMPQGQLQQSAAMAAELAQNRGLLQRIFERMQPALNRISALSSGLRLQVLDATLPVIETAVTGLYDMWRENRGRIESFLDDLPELVARGVQVTLETAADSIDYMIGIYRVLRQIWHWARGTLGPIFLGIADAVGVQLPGELSAAAGGGTGAGATAGTATTAGGAGAAGGTQAPSGDGLRGRTRGAAETIGKAAGWAVEHPWLTLGGAMLGPAAAWHGVGAAIGGNPVAIGAGGAAVAGGAGWYAGGRAAQADSTAGQAGWGAGGVLGGAAAGAATGAMVGSIIPGAGTVAGALTGAAVGAGIAGLTGIYRMYREMRKEEAGAADLESEVGTHQAGLRRRRGYVSMEDVAMEMGYTEEEFGEGLGVEASDRVRDEWARRTRARPSMDPLGYGEPTDPVERAMRRSQEWLRRQAERFDPENIKQAIVEGQREAQQQAEGRDLGTLNIGVEPSPEFAAQMEYEQSMQMFRSIQLAVS